MPCQSTYSCAYPLRPAPKYEVTALGDITWGKGWFGRLINKLGMGIGWNQPLCLSNITPVLMSNALVCIFGSFLADVLFYLSYFVLLQCGKVTCSIVLYITGRIVLSGTEKWKFNFDLNLRSVKANVIGIPVGSDEI